MSHITPSAVYKSADETYHAIHRKNQDREHMLSPTDNIETNNILCANLGSQEEETYCFGSLHEFSLSATMKAKPLFFYCLPTLPSIACTVDFVKII